MSRTTQHDDSIVGRYMAMLRVHKHLKHEELMEVFSKMSKAADSEKQRLKNYIITCNLRLVVSIAKRYKRSKVPFEDLVQEGNIGLIRAVEKFDHTLGFAFSTYAQWWIRQAINQHVLRNKKLIRLPAHAAAIQRKIMTEVSKYRREFGREPTADELVALLPEDSETVVRATVKTARSIISMNTTPAGPIIEHNGRRGESMLIDNLEDEEPPADAFDLILNKELVAAVREIIKSLPHKESVILRLRCGISEQDDDDQNYGITEDELEMIERGEGLT